jgi:hypothetical protein
MVNLNIQSLIIDLFLIYSDVISLFIAFIILFIRYKHINGVSKKWIFLFYLLFLLLTFFTTALIFLEKNNTWIYNLIPLLITLPLFFFFNEVHFSKRLKWFNKIFVFVYLASAIIAWKSIFQLNLNPLFYLLFSFYILINSVGFLYEEMITMRSQNIFNKIEFWFISCLFFYAIICVIVWSLFSYLEKNQVAKQKFMHPFLLWIYCHNTVLFIQSFVFSIAIFKIASRK